MTLNIEVLKIARQGLVIQLDQLEKSIAAIDEAIEGKQAEPPEREAGPSPGRTRRTRVMSAEAKARVSEAQKKRWEEYQRRKDELAASSEVQAPPVQESAVPQPPSEPPKPPEPQPTVAQSAKVEEPTKEAKKKKAS